MRNKPIPGNAIYFDFEAGVQKRKPSGIEREPQNANKYLQSRIPPSNSSPKPMKTS